jgi:predicted small secreted protein
MVERSCVPIISIAGILPRQDARDLKEVRMRKVLSLALVASAVLVSACNTVEGVGKDVKSAGSTVEKTADKSK